MSLYTFEADPDNFAQLVVDNSRKGPVLVNWWSPNAGPCLRLYPLLEKLSSDYAGRFLLVNINADTHKALAREWSVNSLPLLMLFKGGELQESVYGYQSEVELRRLLDRFTPRVSDHDLAIAVREYQQGDPGAALVRLVQIAMDDPANLRVPAVTAKLLMREGRLDEAQRLLELLPVEIKRESDIGLLLDHLLFLRLAADTPGIEELQQQVMDNPDNLQARHQLAAIYLLQDDYQKAMDELLEMQQRDADFQNGAGRQGLLAVFRILGKDNPLVVSCRQRMLDVLS